MLRNSQVIPAIWALGLVREMGPHKGKKSSDKGPVSEKVPKTFRARKAICTPTTRLFCEAGLFICCKGNKNKITAAKFRASRRLRFKDTKRIMSPEMCPKSFGTFEERALGWDTMLPPHRMFMIKECFCSLTFGVRSSSSSDITCVKQKEEITSFFFQLRL